MGGGSGCVQEKSGGKLAQLRTLYLSESQIGDAGLYSVASALGSGAQLQRLDLQSKPASSEAKTESVTDAIENRH